MLAIELECEFEWSQLPCHTHQHDIVLFSKLLDCFVAERPAGKQSNATTITDMRLESGVMT